MAIFESAAGDESGAAGSSPPDGRRRRRADRKAKRKAKRSGATAEKPARPSPAQRKEADVEAAAEQWYDGASALFVLVMAALVGRDLVPNEEQADDIMAPVVRILMRHYDPLRKASADGADALEAATAFALYVQAIYPIWSERRQQRRIERNVRRGPVVPATAQRGPLVANGTRIANPSGSYAAAPAAAAPGGYSTAASGAGGLRQSAPDASRGGDGAGPERANGYAPETLLAEVSGAAF